MSTFYCLLILPSAGAMLTFREFKLQNFIGVYFFPEFPPEEYFTQEESAIEDELSEEGESPKKGKKRKAGKQPVAKSKVINLTFLIFFYTHYLYRRGAVA